MSAASTFSPPWNDRAGRLSWLKLAVFVFAFVPALMLALEAATGDLGVKPYEAAIHEAGEWAIRFLILSLAVTPLRKIAQMPRLVLVRRMLGLTALAYAGLHLMLYVAQEQFALLHVATEIATRIYLTIGFVALLGLVALGATSTDAAVRRLRKNWVRLHRLAYPIAILATLHFFMQSKADVSQATLIAGFFVLLMGYRIADAAKAKLTAPMVLAGVALLATAATVMIEYLWYDLATRVPADRVLLANFDTGLGLRPAWTVAIVGLVVALLPTVQAAVGGARRMLATRPLPSASRPAGRP